MAETLERKLRRWVEAGLLAEDTARSILDWEGSRPPSSRWRWPVWVAVALGAVALGAGIILFVAANWDDMGSVARLALVLTFSAVFHLAGAALRSRSWVFALAFHGLGTVSFGAGIFLEGQIYYLEEHWPGAFLLWATGAWVGWFLLLEWPQLLVAAVTTPIWLAGEWIVRCEEQYWIAGPSPAMLPLSLALVFFTALRPDRSAAWRSLFALGAGWLVPGTILLVALGMHSERSGRTPAPWHLMALAWIVALALPLLMACLADRSRWLRHVAGAFWVAGLAALAQARWDLAVYVWCALGAVALIAWGLEESRVDRINFGVAGFALTVLYFYFSHVMDKLGRSVSLIALGALLLGGGWLLERWRKRLLRRAEEAR